MHRTATARVVVEVVEPARVAFQVAPAEGHVVSESLEVRVAGRAVEGRWVKAEHGTRILVVDALPGVMVLDYSAMVTGPGARQVATEVDLLRYLRPSRYCESDSLGPTARAEFSGLGGADLLAAVSSWVGTRLTSPARACPPTEPCGPCLRARECAATTHT